MAARKDLAKKSGILEEEKMRQREATGKYLPLSSLLLRIALVLVVVLFW